jgi:Apea-like HEPN
MTQHNRETLLNAFRDLASSIRNHELYTPGFPQTDFILQDSSFYRDQSKKISLIGHHNLKKMENFVEHFWDFDPEIKQTVSAKNIKDKVVELLFQYLEDESSVTIDSFQKVLKKILEIPKQKLLVLSPFYGASLYKNSSSKLGPFTLYTWNDYKALVSSSNDTILDSLLKYSYEGRELDKSCPSDFPMLENLGNIFISIQVLARDAQRALELADQRFNQFENIISYMLGHEAKKFNFGVGYSSSRNAKSLLSISSKGFSCYNHLSQENIFPLDLDKSFFFDGKTYFDETNFIQHWRDFGYAWIWDVLLQEPQLNAWHKRILSSIEWIGRGLRDKNPARSLVQFTFALETLFTFQEKGILVTPSIGSTLAEFTAFIVADDLSDRLDVVKKVNKIYSERSAVAHGGSESVSAFILSETINLMKDLITRIITNPDLAKLQTISDVRNWVNEKKYS